MRQAMAQRALAETSVEAVAMVTAKVRASGSNCCSECSGDGVDDSGGRGDGESQR